MSSTRNKNTIGDYQLEQREQKEKERYSTYLPFREPINSYYAGDGLLGGRMASNVLSVNNCDIESQLFGIGSTNLVNPKANITPILKSIKSLNIIEKSPIILPDPLIIEKNQRPSRW
jgi:hypothetical protein